MKEILKRILHLHSRIVVCMNLFLVMHGNIQNLPSNEFQNTLLCYALKPKSAVAKGGGGGGGGGRAGGDYNDVYGQRKLFKMNLIH